MTEARRATGKCSECGELLYHPAQKTCSKSHRDKRARRLKRQRSEQATNAAHARWPEYHSELNDEKVIAEEIRAVYHEELKPVVREALTEEVFRAAQRLVGLTPRMVEAIEEDLHSEDRDLRQRAYTLLARFTLGNQSLMPKEDDKSQPMQVVFNLPRPDAKSEALPLGIEDAVPSEVVELRQCMECHADKPVSEFEGPSERCTACHDAKRAEVMDRFG